jgi:MFS family permease
MGIGVQSMIRRVPMILGPLIGGWLLTHYGWTDRLKYALGLCVAMSLLTAAFQWFLFEPGGKSIAEPENPSASSNSFLSVVRSFTPALRELLVSDILIRFCERIPYAFVILWAMDSGGVTAAGRIPRARFEQTFGCLQPFGGRLDRRGLLSRAHRGD